MHQIAYCKTMRYKFSHMSRHVDWMTVMMKALPPAQELIMTWHPSSSPSLPWEIQRRTDVALLYSQTPRANTIEIY